MHSGRRLTVFQVREGETPTSARAIDEETLETLYKYNTDANAFPSDKDGDPPPIKRDAASGKSRWDAGSSLRLMLSLLYVIAFLCLLRFDEALRIRFDWITLEQYEGVFRLKLELPFRKTHQTGSENTLPLFAFYKS